MSNETELILVSKVFLVRKLLAVCPKTAEKEKTRMAVSKLFVLHANAKLHLVTRKKLPCFT